MAKYRSTLIVAVADVVAANLAAVDAGIDPAGSLNTFSAPLVPSSGDDDAEPTHFGATGILSDAQHNPMTLVSGMLWFRWVSPAGALTSSYDSLNLGANWSWLASIAALGLKPRIATP